ncbi:putative serine/threonine-protein phosphatase [Wickerhamomyces ciferrii]|uniref:Protein phosphatase PP2A regulatory subunit B n=1 Tax=Wickerhamomyces ciferrii (strain ATCC 14091 / BCRC 22168 / CBS 111 / JCM 3599 / NBRC 0793 / NRRL Y-1031 F-60-10) TaxID=1206466 RepID=K0KKN2_WICCF|nr:putative serine/threonine-protein phosphatase [Wickerhamomyces ciferrii]CCH42024.1 putative serine/threonine-protein phosphatase [Wickerhamomyces ciferrii]
MAEDPHNFKFSQCFGDKADIVITEADIISTVEFDHTGDYLATGDRGGRVVLFERNSDKQNSCEYRFHTEFQSHDAEFDYLKSLEIEEKINKIKWCKRTNQAHFLLSTNDKTIKLWKIYDKQIKMVAENNLSEFQYKNSQISSKLSLNSLHLPRLTLHDKIVAASPKRIYSNAHAYHINAISINSDAETFMSTDDLRINLWNLNIPDQSFNIVDIKPANMEELTEVITSAEFHPQSCNLFMYSSSKGAIKLADMRENALCDSHAKVFEEYVDPSNHNFFTEITSSISDVKFSADGRYIASRDYMTVKIWDVAMEKEPVKTINIHEQLRDKLCDTYENDAIFDKFECTFSGDGKSVMTGSYNSNFMIYPDVTNPNNNQGDEIILQADRSAFRSKKQQQHQLNKRKNGIPTMLKRDLELDNIDFKKSILHLSWHPFENSVAIAATNNLYIFSTL